MEKAELTSQQIAHLLIVVEDKEILKCLKEQLISVKKSENPYKALEQWDADLQGAYKVMKRLMAHASTLETACKGKVKVVLDGEDVDVCEMLRDENTTNSGEAYFYTARTLIEYAKTYSAEEALSLVAKLNYLNIVIPQIEQVFIEFSNTTHKQEDSSNEKNNEQEVEKKLI